MYQPKGELLCFEHFELPRRCNSIRALLEAFVAIDRQWLEEYPSTPLLYQAVPKYIIKPRPLNLDSWQDIPRTIQLQTGDCKDFACWRVAELRHSGKVTDCAPFIKTAVIPDPQGIRPPMTVYHIIVRIEDRFEDPSAILGMPTNIGYNDIAQ